MRRGFRRGDVSWRKLRRARLPSSKEDAQSALRARSWVSTTAFLPLVRYCSGVSILMEWLLHSEILSYKYMYNLTSTCWIDCGNEMLLQTQKGCTASQCHE